MTVAAGFGVNLAASSDAMALPLPLTPPDTVDYYDVGDSLVQTALPTMPLVKVCGRHRRPRLARPAAARIRPGHRHRAAAMMIAEELDVPLSMVDVTAADARPELVFNQISGGSAAVRCFDAALPLIAAGARARLLAAAAQQWGISTAGLTRRRRRRDRARRPHRDLRLADRGRRGAAAADRRAAEERRRSTR